jgi:hypothetical protein
VPREQGFYREEGKYEAYVSGYDATLDSLRMYEKTIEILHTIEKQIYLEKKWSVLAGCELGSDFKERVRIEPKLGVSVGNNFVFFGYDIVGKEVSLSYIYQLYQRKK